MILVTGGTGFIGAHLLFKLAEQDCQVKALKRKNSSTQLTRKIFSYYTQQPERLLKNIEWIEGDLLDVYSLLVAFEGVDQLYHAAAMVSLDSADEKKLLATNIEGTANVVNAALEKKVKKLCYVSSIGALGYVADHELIDDETPWDASLKKSLYSKSKHEAEREVWRGMAEGLNAVIVNPSVVLGPGNWNHGSPKIFNTIYKGLKFYPQGTNGFVDVKDVVKAMILLMNTDATGARYIVSSENISYKKLFTWMAEELQVESPKYKAGKWLGEAGWRLSKLISLFNGHQQSITKSAVRSSNRSYAYSNSKLLNTVKMHFMPVRESVAFNAKIFLLDHAEKNRIQ